MELWKNKKILIVDDTPKVVDALKSLYQQVGLDVIGSAANGVEALERTKELKPDLVSLDIIMPEMDGVECYRKLRDNEEFSKFRPKLFFVTYLATEPKILETYKEEIPQHLFVPKVYSQELIRSVLNRLYTPEVPKPPSETHGEPST